MTKLEKLKTLQALKVGLLFLSDLAPKAKGCFIKLDGKYYNNGNEYSESEFKKWLVEFELQNHRRKTAGINEEIILIII